LDNNESDTHDVYRQYMSTTEQASLALIKI